VAVAKATATFEVKMSTMAGQNERFEKQACLCRLQMYKNFTISDIFYKKLLTKAL